TFSAGQAARFDGEDGVGRAQPPGAVGLGRQAAQEWLEELSERFEPREDRGLLFGRERVVRGSVADLRTPQVRREELDRRRRRTGARHLDQSGDDGLELLRSSPVPAPGGRDQLDAELRYDVRHAHYGALGTSLDRGRGELGVAGKD